MMTGEISIIKDRRESLNPKSEDLNLLLSLNKAKIEKEPGKNYESRKHI